MNDLSACGSSLGASRWTITSPARRAAVKEGEKMSDAELIWMTPKQLEERLAAARAEGELEGVDKCLKIAQHAIGGYSLSDSARLAIRSVCKAIERLTPPTTGR